MGGGQDEPCMPRSHLPLIAEKLGRPCPRVELDAANAPLAPMFSLLFSEHLRPLVPVMWQEIAETVAEEDRLPLLLRLSHAASSDVVLAKLYPAPKGK